MAPLNSWNAVEVAAKLAADFTQGNTQEVADTLIKMDNLESVAVALFVGDYLTPAKRALLANLVMEG